MLDQITDVATIVAATLALATFTAYAAVARWWQTRSGTAVMILYVSMLAFGGHYVIVTLTGEPAPLRRLAVIGGVALALAWNLSTILWKQWTYRHDDEE